MMTAIFIGLGGVALFFIGYLIFSHGKRKEGDWIAFIVGFLIIIGGLVMFALAIRVYN